MKMHPLPPIEIPWRMKALESAETRVEQLDDGRLRFAIKHEIIAGVTPAMLVWWFNNMVGTIRIGDVEVPRYRAWHPRDHVAIRYARRAKDGSNFGAGSRVHIREFFNANPRYKADIIDDVAFLDETGFSHSHRIAGVILLRMDYRFTAVAHGTLYENELVVGVQNAPLFNRVFRRFVFPEHMGRAWLRHNVEEVGNFQFFLPDLYNENQ